MLDAYIIDAIRRDEERRREVDAGRARLELPVPGAEGRAPEPATPDADRDDDHRGVVIIPLSPNVPLRDDAA